MSRRWVLRRGMQVAAASAVAGVVAHQTAPTASAEDFDYIDTGTLSARNTDSTRAAIYGQQDSGSQAAVQAVHKGTGPALSATSNNTANGAVEARANNGISVSGAGRTGVSGASSHNSGNGVYGNNPNNVGVLGEGLVGVRGTTTTDGYTAIHGWHKGTVGTGVAGDGTGSAAGVLGRSPAGDGVRGEGAIGVRGKSTTTDQAGVYGEHASSGPGVVGDGRGAGTPGVWGRNSAGDGVVGDGKTGVVGRSSEPFHGAVYGVHSNTGCGVVGDGAGVDQSGVLGRHATSTAVRGEGKVGVHAQSTASTSGYGLVVEGGKAQVRNVPSTAVGRPTGGAHSKGELLVDKNCAVYICTVAGTPGTWRKLSTTAA